MIAKYVIVNEEEKPHYNMIVCVEKHYNIIKHDSIISICYKDKNYVSMTEEMAKNLVDVLQNMLKEDNNQQPK